MRKIYLSLLFVFSIVIVKAQSSEFSVQANSGFSHYTGSGTVGSTFLNNAPQSHSGYPNGDGNLNATIYGFDAQWQYIFKCNFILGLQAGYEAIGSKVNINGVDAEGGEISATGSVTNRADYINVNPYIGFRFNINKVRFDIMPGLDLAFGVGSQQSGTIKASNGTYYNENDNFSSAKDDVRLRLGLAAYYKKFGITAGYSHGLVNFNADEFADKPVPALRINVIRIGISYIIF